jgi:hypothetical protein
MAETGRDRDRERDREIGRDRERLNVLVTAGTARLVR